MQTCNLAGALAALAALGLAPSGRAQAPEKPPVAASQDAATPAARCAAVKKDHEQAMKAFETAYEAAKTDDERQKLVTDKLPKPEAYVARMLAIAKAAPKDPAAAECLVWALQNGRDETQADAVLQALLRDHLASDKLGAACDVLVYGDGKGNDAFLRAVLQNSPHRPVQAKAGYALGRRLLISADQARAVQAADDPERVQRLAEYYGKDWLQQMQKADPAALQKEGEGCLEQVVAKFGDVKSYRGTMGERAKADLFELRNLAVGKPAPEIEGEDLDGVKFKLSDYRGKVVFLDFWGYW